MGSNSLLLTIGSALSLVLLCIFLLAWVIKKLNFITPISKGQNYKLQLRGSCSLGNREKIVIIEVDNQCLVLGVTANQITHLYSFPASDVVEEIRESPNNAFQALVKNYVKKNRSGS